MTFAQSGPRSSGIAACLGAGWAWRVQRPTSSFLTMLSSWARSEWLFSKHSKPSAHKSLTLCSSSLPSPAANEGISLRPVNALRAVEPGTVSVSMSGDEVAIALARALTLDTTGYQASEAEVEAGTPKGLGRDSVDSPSLSSLQSPFHSSFC
jgi:hypothetical protein